jgi:hypothetical protein
VRDIYILGNGFDLAHKLKTTYNDFLNDYFRKTLWHKYSLSKNYAQNHNNLKLTLGTVQIIEKELFQLDYKEIISSLKKLDNHKIEYVNPFLEHLVESSNNRWVDIEMEYYNLLKLFINKNRVDQAKRMVQGLKDIKNTLRDYLLHEVEPTIDSIRTDLPFSDFFRAPRGSRIKPLLINFNYTSTASKYVNEEEIISIHGNVNKTNPDKGQDIIFGFGDERDNFYQQLEDMNENMLLDNSKSFGYFSTTSYQNLVAQLNSTDYKCHIIGHSCGLSDRTLLSMIFEHDNCKKIQIHYYEKYEDHFIKTQEISRHFKDKIKMRFKIVPFEKSTPCPQISKS